MPPIVAGSLHHISYPYVCTHIILREHGSSYNNIEIIDQHP